jgi:hypothetical protein
MFGYSTNSDHQLYRYATEDAVLIVNSFYYKLHPHVTTITQNYSLRCITFTQLTIIHVRNYNHLLHSYTG